MQKKEISRVSSTLSKISFGQLRRIPGSIPLLLTALAVVPLAFPQETNLSVYLLWIAAVSCLILWVQRRPLKSNLLGKSIGSAAGTLPIPRLALALVIGSSAGLAPSPITYWLMLLPLALASESLARNVTGKLIPVAANLPGFSFNPRPLFPSAYLFIANTIVLPIASLHTVNAAFGLITLILSAFTCLAALILFVHAAVVLKRSRNISGTLTQALEAYSPRFGFHWKAPGSTAYQIKMWLGEIDKLEENYFILVRSLTNFKEIAPFTDKPVVLREGLTQLDHVIVPSLKAMLYCNTAAVNGHLIRYKELTHIQLNHGDSDKAPSYNPVFRMFDKNFVAGQAAIDRFADRSIPTHDGFFEIVGRPQIVDLKIAEVSPDQSIPKTVLYAPTWHGFYAETDYSSLPYGSAIVQELIEQGHRVIFRPHAYSLTSKPHRRMRDEVIKVLECHSAGNHIYGEAAETADLFDLFDQSDAMISDISSVVSDYLYTEKPYFMVTKISLDELDSEAPVSRASYILDASLGNLTDLRETIQLGLRQDPLREKRVNLKKYYLGDFTDLERQSVFQNTLKKYIS